MPDLDINRYLKERLICRDSQLDLLEAFLTGESATLVPCLIVHGYKSVGKTFTVEKYLESLNVKTTIVRCDECVTKKLLLQRCLKRIRLNSGVDLSKYNQTFKYKGNEVSTIGKLCETFSNFAMTLEQFMEDTEYNEHQVLVLDRFDQCMDTTNDLFAAFLNLQEQTKIRNLSIVFIISGDEPKEVVTRSIPHIYFPPYSQEEVTRIFLNNQFCFFNNDIDNTVEGKDYWKKYAKIIVDLFFSYTGSNLSLLRDLCSDHWKKFANPIIEQKYKLSEIVKVYRDVRESLSSEFLLSNSSAKEEGIGSIREDNQISNMNDLPIHSKFILIASYLASFNEPKNDLHHFSRLLSAKKKRKKSRLTKSKKTELSKDSISARLLSPNYFDLERLLAIISVIYRNESSSLNVAERDMLYSFESEHEHALREKECTKFTINSTIDLNSQIATLLSLGLLTRTFALDVLSSKIRWKCNVSWLIVSDLAKSLNFPLQNYLSDDK